MCIIVHRWKYRQAALHFTSIYYTALHGTAHLRTQLHVSQSRAVVMVCQLPKKVITINMLHFTMHSNITSQTTTEPTLTSFLGNVKTLYSSGEYLDKNHTCTNFWTQPFLGGGKSFQGLASSGLCFFSGFWHIGKFGGGKKDHPVYLMYTTMNLRLSIYWHRI